jgi:AcrR family transcriptional regulator
LKATKRKPGRPLGSSEPEPRRDELVLAAYRRIAESGFEGLRTRDVAADAGVNIATLHYYFPTKEALIRGVVGLAMGRFRSTFAQGGTPGDQLAAHFRGVRRLNRAEPELFAVMGELALRSARDASISAIFQETIDTWHAILRGLLRHAQREGNIRSELDPDTAASFVIATFSGVFMLPFAGGGRKRLEQTLSQLEAFLGVRRPASRAR